MTITTSYFTIIQKQLRRLINVNYTKYSYEEFANHTINLLELVEDIVQYYCDEEQISGELAYQIVEGISGAKLSQFPVNQED